MIFIFCAGILLLISPGTTFQIIVAIIFSLCFIKIYERFSPLNDEAAAASKNIAQWQFFIIFFLVLLIKTDSVEEFSDASIATILIFALFANMLHDIFFLLYEKLTLDNDEKSSRNLSTSFPWRSYFLKSSGGNSVDILSPTVASVQMSVKSPLRNDEIGRTSEYF